MKMSIEEFIRRQDEFEGYKIKLKTEMNGIIRNFERLVNDKFCNPNSDMIKVLEVEILEYVGITTLKVDKDGRMCLETN